MQRVRAIVDAFGEHFGSRTRLHTLKQIATTLGVVESLYFVAYCIESAIRPDTLPGIAVAAKQPTAELKAPLEWLAIHQFPDPARDRRDRGRCVRRNARAGGAPSRGRGGREDAAPGGISRRHGVAALGCAIMITVLVRV